MRVIALVLAMTSVAAAQAPGEVAPQPVGGSHPSFVMGRPWSIAIGLGAESLTAKTDGAKAVGFGGIELAGRFRIRPPIEVALALEAMGNQGISTAGIYAEFRYRFLAEQPWNPFALGSLGVASAADKNGTDAERKGRGSLRIGGGIERRIGNVGIEATLRLVAIAQDRSVTVVTTAGQQLARYGDSGVELLIGAGYYF
jgi:hypothetical protein